MSTVRIQVRRGTASDWTTANPTLAAGEVGFDTTSNKMKIGDGSTAWSSLSYISSDAPGVSEIAQDAIAQALTMGSGISKAYDDAANTITLTNSGVLSFNSATGNITLNASGITNILGYTPANAADLTSLSGQTSSDISAAITTAENYTDTVVGALKTSDIAEDGNKYFTDERAQDAIGLYLGSGLSYNDPTGAISNSGVINVNVNEQQLKTSGHTGNITLGLADSVVVTNNLGVGANLIIGGNLQVNGTTTTVNSATLSVRDNLIYLNQPAYATVTGATKTSNTVTYTVNDIGNIQVGDVVTISGATPTAYNITPADAKTITAVSGNTFTVSKTVSPAYTSGGSVDSYTATQPDLGFVAGYQGTDNVHHHSGLYRDASGGGAWTFFDGLTVEPGVTIAKNDASFALATVKAGQINATGISVDNNVSATQFTGALQGNVTGNVTGNLTGNVTGNTTGTHTGLVIGNVTGNVTGSLYGNADTATKVNHAVSVGTGLTGTSFDGSTSSTIAIDSTVATLDGVQTFTHKTISGASNTLTNIGNSSLTNSGVTIGSTSVSLGGTIATIAGLTLTSPVIATISNTGTLSLPTSTDTLVGRATTDILTNKSISGSSNTLTNIPNSALTNSSISVNGTSVSLGGSISGIATNASPTFTGTVTLPLTTSGYVTTNSSGVISSVATIPNAGLTNSKVTIGSTDVSLGASATTIAGLTSVTSTGFTGALTGNTTGTHTGAVIGNADTATKLATARNINGVAFDGSAAITVKASTTNALTIGTGLSGTSFDGSGAVTIAIDSTVATLAGTQTLTNKTLDTAGAGNVLKINGTQVSAVTGTGSVVLAASPTLTGTLNAAAISTSGDVTVGGNLTVNGTTTTINSTTVTTSDSNIEIAKVASPTDITANGAGITVKGATDKTINWYSSTAAFTSSENLDIASGKTYKINGTTVLSATAVGGQTIPASAIVGVSDTQTLTNKTFDTAGAGNVFKINGTAISANTGTGSVVLATSPTIATPTITGTLTASASGITFSDATVQTTAGVPSLTTIATAVAANNTTYYPSLDRDKMVPISGTYTLTIAQDGTNTAPIGTSVDFYQSAGTGGAFAAGAGVTILSTPGLKLRTTGSVATIMKTAANTWLLFGDLSA